MQILHTCKFCSLNVKANFALCSHDFLRSGQLKLSKSKVVILYRITFIYVSVSCFQYHENEWTVQV